MMDHSARRSLASRALVLGLLGAATLASCVSAFAQPTTIAQDMVAATKRYVAEKSEEVIKAQSKQAIVAAYKKLYRSGADKRMLRALGTVALSAEEIDTFADTLYASVAFASAGAIALPAEHEERSVHAVDADFEIDGELLPRHHLAVIAPGRAVALRSAPSSVRRGPTSSGDLSTRYRSRRSAPPCRPSGLAPAAWRRPSPQPCSCP